MLQKCFSYVFIPSVSDTGIISVFGLIKEHLIKGQFLLLSEGLRLNSYYLMKQEKKCPLGHRIQTLFTDLL